MTIIFVALSNLFARCSIFDVVTKTASFDFELSIMHRIRSHANKPSVHEISLVTSMKLRICFNTKSSLRYHQRVKAKREPFCIFVFI